MSIKPKSKEPIKKSTSIWSLITGVTLVTLYFNTNAQDPFNTPKLIILMVLSGWLSGHIFAHYRSMHFRVSKREKIFIFIPFIFIFAQVISLFFTDISIVGVVGDTQRRNGFLSYLSLAVVLIFCVVSMNYYYVLRVIKSAIVIGIALCTYGLLQITGNDFVSWNNPYNSMIATVGNPNFASSLLALIALIALFSLFNKQFSAIHKVIAVSVVLISLWLIIDSQSRQGLLVMAFAILFYIVILAMFNFKKLKIPVVLTSTSVFIFAVLGMLQMGPLSSILYKDSVTVRGYYWRAAWEMFLNHPFTGVGLDRYGAYFKQYRESGYSLKYGYEITSSNAHNVYLQLLSTGGIFVGLSYLVLLALIFGVGIQNIKRTSGNTQKINLMMLSSWVGFQAQAMISIDNIGISIWGWILGGCILGINLNSQDETLPENNKQAPGVNRIQLFQPIVSSIILIPVIYFSYNLYKIETNTFLAKSYSDVTAPENAQTVYNYAKPIIDNSFADPYYKLLASLYIADMGYTQEAYRSLVSLHEKDPRNLDVLRVLAEYEKSRNNTSNEIAYRVKIAKLDPWNAVNYYDLGLLYKQQGDGENLAKIREKIISFASNTEIADKAKVDLN
jgi:O-antigen ligase